MPLIRRDIRGFLSWSWRSNTLLKIQYDWAGGGHTPGGGGTPSRYLACPFGALPCRLDPGGLPSWVQGVAESTIVSQGVGLLVTFHIHVGGNFHPQNILKSGIQKLQ